MSLAQFSPQRPRAPRPSTDLGEEDREAASRPENADPSTDCGALPARPTAPAASSAPAHPAHPLYYFQDEMAVFLVDGCLFRVHRYFLDREAVGFPNGMVTRDDPIELSGITKAEFESLLDFLYEGMHNDRDPPSLSSWTALLSISTHFSMPRIRARAISEISAYPAPGLDPVDQVALATKHDIPEWLHPAYAALCQRENALELGEAEKLGMRTTVLVASAREAVRKQAGRRASSFEDALVERVVEEIFWPSSSSASALFHVPVPVRSSSPPQEATPEEESLSTSHSAMFNLKDKHDARSAAKGASRLNPVGRRTTREQTSTKEIGDKGNLERVGGDEREKELRELMAKRDQEGEEERVRQVAIVNAEREEQGKQAKERADQEQREKELTEGTTKRARAEEEERNRQLAIAVIEQEKELKLRATWCKLSENEQRRMTGLAKGRAKMMECEKELIELTAEQQQVLSLREGSTVEFTLGSTTWTGVPVFSYQSTQ